MSGVKYNLCVKSAEKTLVVGWVIKSSVAKWVARLAISGMLLESNLKTDIVLVHGM